MNRDRGEPASENCLLSTWDQRPPSQLSKDGWVATTDSVGAHRRPGNRRSDRHRPFRENRTSYDATEGSSTVTVHVYRAEEGGFWAEMPEYPGCYTQGETMDELKENVREAVQCYIDGRVCRPANDQKNGEA